MVHRLCFLSCVPQLYAQPGPAQPSPAQPAAPCPSRRELCNCSKLQNCGWRRTECAEITRQPSLRCALDLLGASLFRAGAAGAESEYEWVEHWAGSGDSLVTARVEAEHCVVVVVGFRLGGATTTTTSTGRPALGWSEIAQICCCPPRRLALGPGWSRAGANILSSSIKLQSSRTHFWEFGKTFSRQFSDRRPH